VFVAVLALVVVWCLVDVGNSEHHQRASAALAPRAAGGWHHFVPIFRS
jgi:hypothetical protein